MCSSTIGIRVEMNNCTTFQQNTCVYGQTAALELWWNISVWLKTRKSTSSRAFLSESIRLPIAPWWGIHLDENDRKEILSRAFTWSSICKWVLSGAFKKTIRLPVNACFSKHSLQLTRTFTQADDYSPLTVTNGFLYSCAKAL